MPTKKEQDAFKVKMGLIKNKYGRWVNKKRSLLMQQKYKDGLLKIKPKTKEEMSYVRSCKNKKNSEKTENEDMLEKNENEIMEEKNEDKAEKNDVILENENKNNDVASDIKKN
jgi:hypothetical protein